MRECVTISHYYAVRSTVTGLAGRETTCAGLWTKLPWLTLTWRLFFGKEDFNFPQRPWLLALAALITLFSATFRLISQAFFKITELRGSSLL